MVPTLVVSIPVHTLIQYHNITEKRLVPRPQALEIVFIEKCRGTIFQLGRTVLYSLELGCPIANIVFL